MSQKVPRRRYKKCDHRGFVSFHQKQIVAVGGGQVQNLGWAYVCIFCDKWGGWVEGDPRRKLVCK